MNVCFAHSHYPATARVYMDDQQGWWRSRKKFLYVCQYCAANHRRYGHRVERVSG